jgi:hypothetical protein
MAWKDGKKNILRVADGVLEVQCSPAFVPASKDTTYVGVAYQKGVISTDHERYHGKMGRPEIFFSVVVAYTRFSKIPERAGVPLIALPFFHFHALHCILGREDPALYDTQVVEIEEHTSPGRSKGRNYLQTSVVHLVLSQFLFHSAFFSTRCSPWNCLRDVK